MASNGVDKPDMDYIPDKNRLKNKTILKRDIFAEIAAMRASYRDETLVEPKPPNLQKRFLPMDKSPKKAFFKPTAKIDTPAKLQRELERQRLLYKKFMKDLAPKIQRTRISIPLEEFDWRIETDRDRAEFSHTLAGRGKWERVRIPHYGAPLGRAVTYYRTTFNVTRAMHAKGALFICFKGVDYKAHVFMNDTYLGSHEGFFAPFEFEFTSHARIGKNVLLVKVENDAIHIGNNLMWDRGGKKLMEGDKIYAATGPGYNEPVTGWHHCPPGMGIYQDAYVESRATIYIHDIFVRPLVEEGRAEAWIEVWNCDSSGKDVGLQLSIFGQNFRATIFRDRSSNAGGPMGPGKNYLRFAFDLPNMRLWERDTPWLYQIQVKLLDAKGWLYDMAARQFGMRSFYMDEESKPKGRMYLNGREIRLRGANTMGHMQQCVMKKDWKQLRDDILLAKICNMNFFRLTQRPVQPEIYEYCDRLGMMTQTDLPLFGGLRRNQFCEAVKQAGEMEQLVRNHPCNIMVTYINEPFPMPHSIPWRHLTRSELESFFRTASERVHLANPDRVIKPVDGDLDPPGPGLPDNHCYPGWYSGHGLPLGKFHKGYWREVKPCWMYGCGEFGAEGLDPVNVMRKYYPKDWLPQSKDEEYDWTPSRIPGAQTCRFHYMWFDTQHSLKEWVSASQAHQAWNTRLMAEAFRRDNRMNSFAIHLFIDAFPSGWMKTIMDVDRQPKPAYFVYRDILTPLMVSLRTDRQAFFSGEEMRFEAWVCNDLHEVPKRATIHYQIEMDDKVLQAGKVAARVPACESAFQGFLRFRAPEVNIRTCVTIRLGLLDAKGKVLHDTVILLDIFPRLKKLVETRAYILGGRNGIAARLAREIGLKTAFSGTMGPKDIILIDSFTDFKKMRRVVTLAVRKGACAVFLELPEGKYAIAGGEIEVVLSSIKGRSLNFVSRATGHPLVKDFEPNDFRFWYDARVDYPTPVITGILSSAPGWDAILESGIGGWVVEWRPALAAVEKKDGQGLWRICQVHLSERLKGNPAAKIFARRLLEIK